MRQRETTCPVCQEPIARRRRNNAEFQYVYIPCGHTIRDPRDKMMLMLSELGFTLDTSGAVPIVKGGTFDGQPLYVPWFWMHVEADHTEIKGERLVYVQLVGETDPIRRTFPELGKKTAVRLAFTPDHRFVEEL